MRVLVCPDSYKGVLSAFEAAQVMKNAVIHVFPHAEIDFCPMADGGEGTLSVWVNATKARVLDVCACDPFGNPITCQAAFCEDTEQVLLEAAQTCGLPSLQRRMPKYMLSTGLGLAIKNVLAMLPKARIHVALGGTGTVDGGLGAAMALGLRVFSHGQEIFPVSPLDLPEDLRVTCDFSFAHPPVFLCDTQAFLLGPNGAVALFGAQKGVCATDAPNFEKSLSVFARALAQTAGMTFLDRPGFGAAGGLAVPFSLLWGSLCVSGARTLMQTMDFVRRVRTADFVITGEGRLDTTSFLGKLVGEIYTVCRDNGRKVWVFPGQVANLSIPPDMHVFPTSCVDNIPAPERAAHDLFCVVVQAFEKLQENHLS